MINSKTEHITITMLENLQAEGYTALVRHVDRDYFLPSKWYPDQDAYAKEDVLLIETALREMTDEQLVHYMILI